jgi:formylglycine-generating enzyme required for sulfatase activity
MRRKPKWMLAALVVLAFGTAAQADTITHGGTTINMDFVPVGNAGNTADYTGCGAVGYNFRIGKYEVTAAQWAAVRAAAPGVGNGGKWSGSQPTGGTSWYEAAKFCNWLTTGDVNGGVYNTSTWATMDHQTAGATYGTAYFIPTEDEWYKAAYHKNNGVTGGAANYWRYPTCSDTPPTATTVANQLNASPGSANYNSVVGSPTNVGAYNLKPSTSAYGTFDQGGNVWEWNETLVGSVFRGTRGGCYFFGQNGLAPPRVISNAPALELAEIGFRVASVPEPSTFALLGIGAVGLMGLAWRRRKRLLRYTPLGAAVLLVLVAGVAQAVVIETVPVGNPGNIGQPSGEGGGGVGPYRICGAVNYVYRIGKFEVTAGQYKDFLNAVAKTDTYGLYNAEMWSSIYPCKIQQSGTAGNYSYSVAADWANRPVNYVSFWDACRFANWLHNGQPTGLQTAATTEGGAYTLNGYNGEDGRTITRNPGAIWVIPSEDEWYKAAYHKNDGPTGNYYKYPTASNTIPSKALGNPTDPGNNATYYRNGYTIGSPYYRTEVGAHENSDSPYGTFDQGGNVWEWDETVVYETSSSASRGERGGCFAGYEPYLAPYDRYSYRPTFEGDTIGFRVASVPEPGGFAMLAGFAATTLLYYWRKHV